MKQNQNQHKIIQLSEFPSKLIQKISNQNENLTLNFKNQQLKVRLRLG
jgi:hypothetical protein